ncbi:MAG: hypothetical protein R6V15_14175, partial [Desulfotignum sp.]
QNLNIKLNELNYLRYITHNNIGKVLDLLQLTKLHSDAINLETLSDTRQKLKSNMVEGLFSRILERNFKGIRKQLRDILKKKKYSKGELFTKLSRVILKSPIERSVKALFLDIIADVDFTSIDSSNDEIQINKLLSEMARVGKEV